jgi:hypothetical protein
MLSQPVREFDGIRVETSDWPIIVTEFPEGRVSDAALQGMLGHLEALMHLAEKHHERLYFVTDLTKMRYLTPASQRKLTGEWVERTTPLAKRTSAGAAQVTPSAILRGIITAVFWLHPSPTQSVFVATRNEAILRGLERLEAAGEPLSPRLRALRK